MNAIAQALVSCIASGAVFASICAALAVPAAAWLAIRFLAPAIHRMDGDWRAQASLSGYAAAIPGGLFLFLVAYGLLSSASSPCLQTVPGRILFGTLGAMMLAAIVRAIVQAIRRDREAANTVATALPPSRRLARLAARADVVSYVLPEDAEPIVMLFGRRNPAVFVSSRALRDLSDRELLAALHHERAHRTRGDHWIAPVLYFLTDLLPLRSSDLVSAYRRSREFCADQCAVRHAAAPDLAAALLRMIAPGAAPAHAAALAETSAVRDRLRALLAADLRKPNLIRRALVAIALSSIVAAGVAAPQIAGLVFHCSRMGLPS